MNTKNITVIDMEVNTKDYPELADSFIIEAEYKDTGIGLTDVEIDELNDDSDFVYNQCHNFMY